MRDIFRNCVTHGSVQFLFAALFLCAYTIHDLALWHSWPWVLVVIASAPFFEWVTHKYTLHRPLTETPAFGAITKSACITAIIYTGTARPAICTHQRHHHYVYPTLSQLRTDGLAGRPAASNRAHAAARFAGLLSGL